MELQIHSDEYYMKQALHEAERALEENEIPVGAVIVCEKRIIAKAHNQTERLQDITAHAEMLAITSAQNYLGSKYLNDCTLYVTLEPCNMCGGALYWSQIGRVVFAASDEKRGYSQTSTKIIHPKTKVEFGLLASHAEILIEEFFRKMRE
ncbi:MAG: nucleoside deaminase [Cyclobacteriaceae bacterium]